MGDSLLLWAWVASVAGLGMLFGWARWRATKLVHRFRTEEFTRRLDALGVLVHALQQAQATSHAATLRAELDDLRGAVEAARVANRREFGKLWQRLANSADVERVTIASDPEFQALLDLQNAQTPKGN